MPIENVFVTSQMHTTHKLDVCMYVGIHVLCVQIPAIHCVSVYVHVLGTNKHRPITFPRFNKQLPLFQR